MWSRADLKTRAKINLNKCYWKAVLTALLLSIAAGGNRVRINVKLSADQEKMEEAWQYFYYYMSGVGIFIILFLTLFFTLLVLMIKIFLGNPLEIGCKRFFILSRVQETQLNEIGAAFSGAYWTVVKVQFLRYLYISLWSMLFVIPGIIKAYEYRMIPYLLAEDPNLPQSEAFRISRELMEGQKMDTFLLDLSFFGWGLLGACTCGILHVFYVLPYIAFTDAELYITLQYHRYNRIHMQNGGYYGQ